MSPLFKIVLDSPARRNHVPGSVISGYISLDTEKDIDIHRVHITFQGHAHVHVQRRKSNYIHYADRINFFRDEQDVFKGPYTLRANTYQWPFRLAVPLNCQRLDVNPARWGDTSLQINGIPSRIKFNTDLGQCIPPTFSDSNGGLDDNPCRIFYNLGATLNPSRGGHRFQRQLDDQTEIHVAVPRANEHVDPRLERRRFRFETRSLHLNPSTGEAPLSFREKLRSYLHSDKLPRSVFIINFQIPTTTIIGSPLPLRIGVSHDFNASTAQIIPLVHLKKLSVELLPHTFTRIETSIGAPWSAHGNSWEGGAKQLAHLPAEGIVVSEDVDLSHLVRLTASDASTPSFETFNICRHYSLSIKATIVCAGVKHQLERLVRDFTVLPAVSPPSMETIELPEDSYGNTDVSSFHGGDPPRFDIATNSVHQSLVTKIIPPPQYEYEPPYGNEIPHANQSP
ncbi:hypothetical protein MMC17_002098 [Xylographa soralifera]|nr:hypothetical protein [Xylographa soralifera]